MKSPNTYSTSTNSFTQSTVATINLSINNSSQYKLFPSTTSKHPIDYSKSYVYQNPRTRKEQPTLRKTMNYDQTLTPPTTKGKLQSFLRNTSYFSIEDDKPQNQTKKGQKQQYIQSKEEKIPWYSNNNLINDNKANNYQKILQKIQKKEMLINELRQLSKFTVTQNIKNASNQKTEKNTGKNLLDKSRKAFDLTKSGYDSSMKNKLQSYSTQSFGYQREPPSNLTYFKEKVEIKLPESSKNVQTVAKNKNPEQEYGKGVFKKAKNSYFTPKETKSEPQRTDDRMSTKLVQSKIQTLEVRQNKPSSTLYSSCRYNNSIQPQYNSPTIRGQQSKTIQDIRYLSDNKKIKSNTSYFTNKKPTIYDFELTKTLGQGKFGTVIKAFHKTTNSIYAIKKISKKVIKANLMADQLVREIKIQSLCQHQNILEIYSAFDDHENIYLLLEYMGQGTLFSELKKKKCFTEVEAASKLKEVVKAVVYLHENGIAHRDIKPENIVMSNGVGKLCDFGWATFCGNDRRKTYCGTFDYAAPEILQGSQYDISVDLWCLGVLAYELLVGKAPFYHISRKQTMKKILNVQNESIVYPSTLSKEAISFIDNLIKKKPEERMTAANILNHPFLLLAEKDSL